MSDPIFVDTNILVCAFSDAGDHRHRQARAVVEALLESHRATVSVQVLKEFYAVVTRKLKKPLPGRAAASIARDLSLACRVVDDTLPQFERTLEIVESFGLSIWDASVLAAAEAARCKELYSEDLADGSTLGQVRIANPLRKE